MTGAAAGQPADLSLVSVLTGERAEITVPAGHTTVVAFHDGPLVPTADLARGRETYPTSPLPPGMTPPAAAVDGDGATAWRPGPDGRMVVDLGENRSLSAITLRWTHGVAPATTIDISTDGLTYTPDAQTARGGDPTDRIPTSVTARYVAVAVAGSGAGQADLAELAVTGQ